MASVTAGRHTALEAPPTVSNAKTRPLPLHLVNISGEVDDDGPEGSASDLLYRLARGLLHPTVPLSSKAAEKLQKQQLGKQLPTAGDLLKSLPVELLYDDTGLDLFDQITYLPEYYLTEAEASILAEYGADIVQTCVRDGALLVELGAGSMRKTRLLLNAVEHVGRQDVTFAALDLCEDSLRAALTSLQGCGYRDISLTGLVGTYDDGLQYIWQLSQPAEAPPTRPGSDSGFISDCDTLTDQRTRSSGSLDCDTVDGISVDVDIEVASSADYTDEEGPIKQALLKKETPKVFLWLGSSIGNCHREEAMSFLQQVKAKAMRKGDFLLVGIDRRKTSSTIAAAYNDKQGVTRKFILNGLQHCSRLLDAACNPPRTSHTSVHVRPDPGLKPDDFEYFCLYNDNLGRHEAYCQAKVATTINLPAAVVGTGRVPVQIVAGELISVEFSYKYSQEEVEQLAAAAGLVRVKTWTDRQERYNLHMLQSCT